MQDANIVIYQIFFTSLVWLNTLLKCESQDRRVHEPELDFFSKNRCSSNFLSKSNKMFQKLTRLFVPLKLYEIDFLSIWSQHYLEQILSEFNEILEVFALQSIK